MIVLLFALEFLCGSMMFSYWLGLMAGKDLRLAGDGNPGAFNLWQAAGAKLGMLGIILDFMKGYMPLALFIKEGMVSGIAIVPVAASPILGHVFSPFMKFRGGKAIAVSFGVWSAVTGFKVSLLYAVILAVIQIAVKLISRGKPVSTETDGLMVVMGMGVLCVSLAVAGFPGYIITLCLINLIVFVYTNRKKLHNLYMAARQAHKKTIHI